MASSSNYNPGEEYQYQYPYPSHVCAPNFVTVKLSGKNMYGIWKTQMLCLLKSHDMLGFTDGTFIRPSLNSVLGKEKEGDVMLWERSDALVKGWILGSLSEQTLRYTVKTNEDFTAKDVWDKLKAIYGPATLIQQQAANSTVITNTISEDATLSEEEKEQKKIEATEKRKEEEVVAKIHQSLYEATLNQSFENIESILLEGKVKITDKITINGNTALHVAVGTTKKTEFLEKMLNLAEQDNPQLDMRNSEESTLLHVAAIVGNIEAAKMLVTKNRNLLFAKDKDGDTPLNKALSNMHTDTCHYLLNLPNTDDITGTGGEEFLVNTISSKNYHSALDLSANYTKFHSDAVLMAVAQNFPPEPKWVKNPSRVKNPSTVVIAILQVISIVIYVEVSRKIFYLEVEVVKIVIYLVVVTFVIIAALLWLDPQENSRIHNLLQKYFNWIIEGARMHKNATLLLTRICRLIKDSPNSTSQGNYYNKAILEATRQNAYHVVQEIVYYFPDAIWSVNEDGYNIIQYAVINRSEKIYNLLYQMSIHKNIYKTIKDSSGNNLLHLAARLPPINKLNLISGAALQMQRELQWFKEVERFVCPLNIIQKNCFEETPEMVFTREHKNLVIEGDKWMKATAGSYTTTAALIITIVFAAAITVPGGNKEETAFKIFAASDAISLFTSVTSLLMFLSILTSRCAEQDFLKKLPTKLIFGLTTLFISTTSMLVAFGASFLLVFGQRDSWIITPIAILTSIAVSAFAFLQFTLIAELISATYVRSIFGKKRDRPFY